MLEGHLGRQHVIGDACDIGDDVLDEEGMNILNLPYADNIYVKKQIILYNK